MEQFKKLKEMPDDVKQGDLVRIFLEHSNYVGYRWDLEEAKIRGQLLLDSDTDIIFSGLDPYGNTRMEGDPIWMKKGRTSWTEKGSAITKKIQFVGVNMKTHMLGNEHIKGYQVLERTSYEESPYM